MASHCVAPRPEHRLPRRNPKGATHLPGDRSMSDATTLPAPDLRLKEATHAAWEEERRAFLRHVPTLLSTHRGRYVAVHKGSIIADGSDQVEVAKRAYALVGYVPIYVG